MSTLLNKRFLFTFSPAINSNTQLSSPLSNLSFTSALLHNAALCSHSTNPVSKSDLPVLKSTSPQCKHPIQFLQNTDANMLELPISEDFCARILSYCNSKALKEGVCVHSAILKLGFHDHLFLNNNLLSLYAKCLGAGQARKLFEGMSQKDVVSWTGIISAYVREKSDAKALQLFGRMMDSGMAPNEFTFSSVLHSCSSLREFDMGICVHAQIASCGFGSNSVLQSGLLDFYSKHDKFAEALAIFETMESRDTVSWTTMISACVQVEDWSCALRLYSQMIEAGVSPNEYTFVKVLTASSFLGLNFGKLLHTHVIVRGSELNLVLKTTLINMYSRCQRMGDALKISSLTPDSDVMLWTALISGYSQMSDFEGAVTTFRKMEQTGISPNSFAYAGILHACSSILALELGQQIYSRVTKAGLDCDVSVGNALVNMYMKCCATEEALRVFKRIISPNIISWTSLIHGYARHGYDREAFEWFAYMQSAGIRPNSYTISTILSGCKTVEALRQVRKCHAYVLKTKVDSDISVGNSLVDVYARMGRMDDAFAAISMMARRDIITYTSLAAGVNQTGQHDMALDVIPLMHEDGIKIDSFSLATFLSAAANLTAMVPGKQLHCYSLKSGLDCQISVSNGLVDMYGKCGTISDADKAFKGILEPNVVSWNGLISGLASNGYFSSALSTFEDMRLAGINPDGITFLLVLYACSHGGLVDLGLEYFNSMKQFYNIVPQFYHYVCLVDLLGRAGRVEEAARMIEAMPFNPDALIYKTLLGSCKLHRNLALGEEMARRALELDPCDPAIYVLLANMYDDAGKLEFGEQMRRMMRERGLRKNPGQSWMEIRNKVYSFAAGDASNPQINEIHEKIETLKVSMKRLGYHCVENAGSSVHSEKLAVAFGLLNVPTMAPIRIIKNIRICEDCHNFIKLVTRIVDREIVVRDGNRFHHFNKGDCSCKGYW